MTSETKRDNQEKFNWNNFEQSSLISINSSYNINNNNNNNNDIKNINNNNNKSKTRRYEKLLE